MTTYRYEMGDDEPLILNEDQIIRIPETEKELRDFCEEWGWDCFFVGRRAWISEKSTYLRHADIVITHPDIDEDGWDIGHSELLEKIDET